MEVVYEGVLSIGRNPSSNSKDWTQRLFVLKLHRETKRATLDFYKDQRKRWQKQTPKGVISLWPTFKISLAHECGYYFPMKIVNSDQQIYYLSANTFQLMNTWYHHIQMLRTLDRPRKGCYEYKVQAHPSDSMNLIEANGSCLLALTPENEIVCASLAGRHVLGVWPYDSLRRYWCAEGVFGFEAGRRSPRGEGKLEFITDRNEQFYRTLEKCIIKAKQVDSRPPAPLPGDPTEDSDTPPVSTSESEDDSLPPSVPDKHPTRHAQSVRAQSSRPPPGIIPPNLRRVHTHSGAAHKWLHQSCDEGTPPTTKKDLPPVVTEDTYSHTIHQFPAPFQKQSSAADISTQPTYHRLHTQASLPQLPVQPSLVVNNLSDLPEEDRRMYDVAFQPAPQRRAIPSDSAYTSLGAPDPSRVVREDTQQPTNNVPGPTLRGDCQATSMVDGPNDENMTCNPLYGSQDDLLKALDKIEAQFVDMAPPILPPRNQAIDDVVGFEELQISPAYEHHDVKQTNADSVEDKVETNEDSVEDKVETSPSKDDVDAVEAKAKVKGYTKVKKTAKEATPKPDSGDESPPPLPARLYSFDSTGSDQTTTDTIS